MSELPSELQQALEERYEILRELGRGGMAVVYAARDRKLGRDVAIKVLLPDLAMAMGPERFSREIAIAGHLSNPHILAVYDSGQAGNQLYYVMPLIRGESLRARLDRDGQLPIDEALRLTIEVAQALDYAHRQGVVHRDIKPENILLEDGHAIVADFGIARAASSAAEGTALTQTGMTLGTAAYMSPEQVAAEKDIDGRSDIYSLACVAYEMLAGEPPFKGPNAAAIMARQALEMPPSLQVVRHTIPDEVEDAVFQALAKSRVDRFETAAEFADALEDCLALTPTVSRRASMPRVTASTAARRRVKRRRRTLVIAAAVGVPLAGIVVAAAVVLLRGRGGAATAIATPATQRDVKTVAILYFDDRSTDGRLGFLADGLTEALIDELDRVRPLRVISTGGVGQFRGQRVSNDSVARTFEAGTIVRGSVERAGEGVSIGVQVVDGNTGDEVGRKRIDLPTLDIVTLQNAVADSVADFLRVRVGQEVRARALSAGTTNSAALSLVMQAEKLRKDGEDASTRADTALAASSFVGADNLLAKAEQLDRKWATPIVLRGTVALSQATALRNAIDAAPVIERGLQFAARALALDPQRVDALELRGRLEYRRWQLQLDPDPRALEQTLLAARSDLLSVTERDRTRAFAWSTLSAIYSNLEPPDFTQANLAAQRALEEDAWLQGADQLYYRLYATSYDLEQFPKAVQWCADGGNRFPRNYQFVRCRLWTRTTSAVRPSVDSAWADVRAMLPLVPERLRELRTREAQMLVAATLVRAGKPDSARSLLVESRAGTDIDPQGWLLTVEAFVRTLFHTSRDTDAAIDLLGRYVTANPGHREGLRTSTSWWWRDLKKDPRFIQLVGGTASNE